MVFDPKTAVNTLAATRRQRRGERESNGTELKQERSRDERRDSRIAMATRRTRPHDRRLPF